jgi:peroxiredoxin
MKKVILPTSLLAVVVLCGCWIGLRVCSQGRSRPVAGFFHRSKVDSAGHTRGIVQVSLMRQFMEERERSSPRSTEPTPNARHRVASQRHPLVGRAAPAFDLIDSTGKRWTLPQAADAEPSILVFYLGQTCMACVTHLVELDFAISRVRDRGARVLAVSADAPESSRRWLERYGDLKIPLLSDPDHATARAYGAWKPLPEADQVEGRPLHGTFIVDRRGVIRWATVGDRPFTDIEALVAELDAL